MTLNSKEVDIRHDLLEKGEQSSNIKYINL